MNKTIMMGLDGATWNNLLPWIQNGELPFFRSLIHKGVRGVTKSTIPSLTCPAIPSFYTGLHPTRTGAFGFRNQEGKIMFGDKIKGKRFWDILGNNGYSCFVGGVVTTYPAKIKKGVLVSSPFFASSYDSPYVSPEKEKEHFRGWLGGNIKRKDLLKWQRKDRRKLFHEYMNPEYDRFVLVKNYFLEHDFDFKLIYFLEPDRVQHLLWDSPELVLCCYQWMELWIEELIELFPDHNVILFSDHGFGPSPSKAFYVNAWLYQKGLLKYNNDMSMLVDMILKRVYYSGGWGLEKYLSIKVYERFYRFLRGGKKNKVGEINIEQGETNTNYLDMKKTKAYLDQKWGLKVLDKKIVYELIDEMKVLVDNGRSIFSEVYEKEELYKNSDGFDEIPEIIFILNQDYEVRSGYSEKIFNKIKFKRRQEGSHEYRREGIFLAFGPDIKEHKNIGEVDIYDLAPTVLHMYGIKPGGMDGRIIKEVFK